ncbi:MAG TPA: response regulator transcription factor [Clostridiaceae bacterium]|nr:response regulator transcription factor [Clostridiaceae bacterium]
MLQIAICDDNINELSNMVHLLNQYRSSRHLNCEYAVFPNGFDLISALEKGKRFDIYCLDIIMPGFSGIDVAKEIRTYDKIAPILFFTSSTEFALESYSVKAINYVLKPISKEKFFFTFDEILESIKIKKDEDAIIVKSNDGIQKILISNLVYAEVNGRNVLYHLLSGKVIKCTEPFSSVCDNLLKYGCFVKTHRSYIVNMQYVDTIEERQVTLQTLSSVPVAQGKVREIKQQYLAYQMEEE